MIRRLSASDEALHDASSSLSTGHEEEELTASSTESWRKGNYEDCVTQLKKLSLENSSDLKVKTNSIAAQALVTSISLEEADLELVNRFPQELKDVVYEYARAYLSWHLQAERHAITSPLLLLNTANVLFNSKRYTAALTMLKPLWKYLYKHRDAASDEVFVGSSLLLIDVCLALGSKSEAAGVLSSLEQRYELLVDDKSDSEGRASGTPEQGQRDDSIHSGDWSQLSPTSVGSMTERVPKITAGYDLAQLALSYRARLHLLTGDLKGAKRDLRNLLAAHPRHSQALSLKAQLEALRGNLRRAAKLVVTHPEDAQQLEEAEKRQMLCNMGCVQHHEGKHHAAVLCFSKAEATGASKPPPLLSADSVEMIQPAPHYALDAETALLYNAGVQALLVKEVDSAMRCFQRCKPDLCADPMLWLRMADCCVEAAIQGRPLECDTLSGKAVLLEGSLLDTLDYGRQCAEKAIELFDALQCPSEHSREAVGNGDPQSPASQLQSATAAGEEKNWRAGRLSARADLAFLCLQLGLPDTALNAAQTLLEEGEPSCPQWQVGHSYAAEALRELGRAAEAAEHLQSALTGLLEQPLATTPELAANGSVAEEASESTFVAAVQGPQDENAKVLLCINLASTYFSLNNFTEAKAFAKAAADDAGNRDALLMHVYLQLCCGETAAALGQLKAFQLG